MTDHNACIAQLEALNADHNRTVNDLRRAVDTLTDARVLAAELRPLVYARNPDRVDALLDLLLSPVPSAGGDQPDTPCPPADMCPPYGHYVPCPACTDKENPHGQ
jgi:hypothetical protein